MDLLNTTPEEMAESIAISIEGEDVETLKTRIDGLKADNSPDLTISMQKALIGKKHLSTSEYNKLVEFRGNFVDEHEWEKLVTPTKYLKPDGELGVKDITTWKMLDGIAGKLWYSSASEHEVLRTLPIVSDEDRAALEAATQRDEHVALEQELLVKYKIPKEILKARGLKGIVEECRANARMEKAIAKKAFRQMKIAMIQAVINYKSTAKAERDLDTHLTEFVGVGTEARALFMEEEDTE